VAGAWATADLPELPALHAGDPDRAYSGLATDRVRYVGQALGVVAARDRYAAEDGVDRMAVVLDPLPAVVDPTQAAKEGAPALYPGRSNVVNVRAFGDPVPAAVWERAEVVVEAPYVEQLLAPTPIEARAILATTSGGGLTVWCSHQAPHRLRDSLAESFGLDAEQVRVISPDVGGAYGTKSATYPEYLVVAHLARRLGRPVRWIEDRAEALVAATHGRGQNQRVRMAADGEGRFLAIETEIDAGIGGYPQSGDFIPVMTGQMVSGAYAIEHAHSRVRTVVTTTTPTSAYRGAGRPEAAYAIERTVDLVARRLGMDPAEIRRRNFIPPDRFPYRTPSGRLYDSGDYRAGLERALELVEYDRWRAEQRRRRRTGGRPLGIGICTYVERSGGQEDSPELGSVEACPDGTFVARSGSCSTGQGHETTFAQVVATALGVDPGAIRVVEADTAEVPMGIGSFASRSMQVGGTALHLAAGGLVGEARRRAAGLFGSGVDDVGYEMGSVHAGEAWMTLGEVAAATGELRCDHVFRSPQAFPSGAYVAVVEIDPDLGTVTLLRLTAVDDCGVVVNPLVVEGQTRGSITQGIGQALYELFPYDEEGWPQVGSLLDYLLPTIAEVPELALEEMETPNPNTPLGVKGAGEAGCIGTPPAVANAVVDALDLPDPSVLQMPFMPGVVWEAAASRGAGFRSSRLGFMP
jgi:carbon-monoxide dehydrogenase large subunit